MLRFEGKRFCSSSPFLQLPDTAQKWSFPLRISSVNLTKSAVSCGFGLIYWRNPSWKTSFFVQHKLKLLLSNEITHDITWLLIPLNKLLFYLCLMQYWWNEVEFPWKVNCSKQALRGVFIELLFFIYVGYP